MRAIPRASILAPLLSFSALVSAQVDPKVAEIGAFAREFCLAADSTSQSTTVELSGEAKVKLNALISKLVDLEVGGGAKYIDTSTKGVLQKDLAAAYTNTNQCRTKVLEVLIEKLLPTAVVDLSASKLAGRWHNASDASYFINVVVQGQNFHSVEYDKRGRAVGSVDGIITQGNVEGTAYLEPIKEKLYVIPERIPFGTVNMRLSDDAKRLIGTFTLTNQKTKEKTAVKLEWVRP